MKVYLLDTFHPAGVEYIARRADIVRWDDPRAKDWHQDADGLMVRMKPLTASDFGKARRLKAVAKQGVGVNAIDLEAARAHGVAVCNTPGVNAEAVAQLTLGLAIDVSRRVSELDRMIRSGAAVDRSRFLGIELWQATVGIVGMGNVGTRIARKFRGAFDTTIVAYDPYVPADHWPDTPHERARTLDELVRRADVLTLHVPLTKETRGMIGRRELGLMKERAIVLNAARGGIVDEAALYDTLKSGKLFGAGLDVFETEPPTSADPLMTLPNVVATPHAGAGTYETQAKSSVIVAEQLLLLLEGGVPLNRVA
ncbi:MAG: hydroxyacid dehydrogenase [Alphaproteobacteria bacterium]|nr:hydroxyacid dehydrogenase [Alphaproteobacteria bacterium]